jgi:hypothetical protein
MELGQNGKSMESDKRLVASTKNWGCYLSLRVNSVGVVRSEAFRFLPPAARLGLTTSIIGGLGFEALPFLACYTMGGGIGKRLSGHCCGYMHHNHPSQLLQGLIVCYAKPSPRVGGRGEGNGLGSDLQQREPPLQNRIRIRIQSCWCWTTRPTSPLRIHFYHGANRQETSWHMPITLQLASYVL